MPNLLANLMLFSWPLVTVMMYLHLPLQKAIIWSVFSAYMLLPSAMEIDLPLIPGLSKYMIPAFFGYLMASILQGRLVRVVPRSRLAQFFLALLMLGVIGTALTNSDPVFINSRTVISGLRPYDALSMMMNHLGWLLIWALAREYLADRQALMEFARALVVAFLFYSLPMLVEVRLSPQIHIWVYGYFQHDFVQMMRQGGFRPIVFLEHGLWVAILTAMAALTAVVLARDAAPGRKAGWYRAAAYLGGLLVLCKSMAALLYVLALAPLVLWGRSKLLMRVAFVMALFIMVFPLLRGSGYIPTEDLIRIATDFSAERGQSLEFRFHHEDAFLDRAAERPVFGWGGWGRNSVWDPESGEDTSVADGQWIISIGTTGYVGFIGFFGLLTAPVLLMGIAYRRVGREVPVLSAGMALVLSINLLDLIPNATLTPVTWLLTGSLLGMLERLGQQSEDREATPAGLPAAPRRDRFAGLVGTPAALGPRSLL